MTQKCYVVTVCGNVRVDTTVAVMAKSSVDAARMAVEGVDCDTKAWLRGPCLVPVIARWCLYTPSPQSTITVISPLPVAL